MVKSIILHDLTEEISSELTVFPGDPIFEKQLIHKIEKNQHFCLSKISLSNHLGTHIDFPSHVILNGKTSSDYAEADLQGNGLVIEVPKKYKSIDSDFLSQHEIVENDIVFFKTGNSTLSKTGNFDKNYVYVEPEAAELLVKLKVKMVGIDYLSVDQYESENLPAHKILLAHDILIIENLNLKKISESRYQFLIVPSFRIAHMDGVPVRVFSVS